MFGNPLFCQLLVEKETNRSIMMFSSVRVPLLLALVVVTMLSTPATSFVPVSATGSRPVSSAISMADTKDKVESYRKADFIASVSEKTGLSKKGSEEALKAVLETLQEQVGAGKRVNLPGFGTFTLRERAARKGRNPRTGEDLYIAASKSPGFSAAKAWKDAINGK